MAHKHSVSAAAMAYAQAAIELAGDQATELGGEIAELTRLVDQEPALRTFMENPAIRHEERWRVLQRAFKGGSSGLFVNLLGVLSEKNRLSLIHEIATAYQQLLDVKLNRVRAEVFVAQKLDEKELAEIRDRVSASLGKTAIVAQKIDDSIIGGLVLKVQGKVMDASVKAQLDAMRRQLLASRA
jgi:F-type H+-transporting ATPase subunit delta